MVKLRKPPTRDERQEETNGAAIRWKLVSMVLAAFLAVPSAWILTAKTFEPRIPLSEASLFFESFYKQAIDPTKNRAVWDAMVTDNYRKYAGFHNKYSAFARYWTSQDARPDIIHVSKDGPSTFAISLVYHPRKGIANREDRSAEVLVCDDWRASWFFTKCHSTSLRLDDVKRYDFRVVQG